MVWEVSGACGTGELSSGREVVLRWVEEASVRWLLVQRGLSAELVVEALR